MEAVINYVSYYKSPIGVITVASCCEKIIGIWNQDQKYFGSTLSQDFSEEKNSTNDLAHAWLDSYFANANPPLDLPIKLDGTPFQSTVWNRLLEIPYGEIVTYKDVALSTESKSARAVGTAVGRNPISIYVPCHRVIGSSGKLVGYAGGLDKKTYLLELESSK